MELKNMKHEETEWVEVYSKWLQTLAHGLQVPAMDNFLTTMFKVS